MDEKNKLVTLCEYLGRSGVGVFMPEVWRDGALAVFLTSGTETRKQYVNGDRIVAVEFEICSRCAGESANDRLDVLKGFSEIMDYAEKTPFPETEAEVIVKKGPEKAKVQRDGSEEYRVTCELRYLKRRGE